MLIILIQRDVHLGSSPGESLGEFLGRELPGGSSLRGREITKFNEMVMKNNGEKSDKKRL